MSDTETSCVGKSAPRHQNLKLLCSCVSIISFHVTNIWSTPIYFAVICITFILPVRGTYGFNLKIRIFNLFMNTFNNILLKVIHSPMFVMVLDPIISQFKKNKSFWTIFAVCLFVNFRILLLYQKRQIDNDLISSLNAL